MKTVEIDARQLSSLLSKIKVIKHQANDLQQKCEDKRLKKWLDGQEVCMALNVKPRTLQTYRDNGTIGFSRVGTKCYYKSEEVELLIQKSQN